MPEKRKLTLKDIDIAIGHCEAALKVLNATRGAAPKEKQVNPNHDKLKKWFIDFYKKEKKLDYVWSAADGRNLNLLIGRIQSLINISTATNIGTIDEVFKVLFIRLKKADTFVWGNLSISLVNSKFNEIIAKIKNPKGTSREIDDYKKSLEKKLNPK